MNKQLYIGKMKDCGWPVFVNIKFNDGRLSITGVEGPMKSGNAKGSCGQIVDHITDVRVEGDLTIEQITKLQEVWNRCHLNDMKAGSPDQENFLREHPVTVVYPESHYDKTTTALKDADLQPDPNYLHNGKPYNYGSAWLREEVPAYVIEWLEALPQSTREWNWI